MNVDFMFGFLRSVLLVVSWIGALNGASGAVRVYSYDSLQRLTKVDSGDGVVVGYTYDAAGNRLTEVISTFSPAVAARARNMDGTVTLTVNVSGAGTFLHQWYQGRSGDTSNPIVGANATSFTTPVLTGATSYWVQASNGSAAVNSAAITVDPPTIAFSLAVHAVNGTVAKAPDQQTYAAGAQVLLTPVPAAGYEFANWSGDASGSGNPLTVVMDRDRTITANFQALPGAFTLSGSSFSVNEGAGSLSIPVMRLQGSKGSVSVNFSLAGITAGAADFTANSGTLTFDEGVTSRNVVVPILEDSIFEGPETFSITLSNPTGGATLGAITTATVTIIDNDPELPIGQDSDGDGIVDAWELQWFGNLTTAGRGTDSDADGFTDLEEFRRGLNPGVIDAKTNQPDLHIGFSSKRMVGGNIYDSTDAVQRQEATAKRGKGKTCLIYIENDSMIANTITLSGDEVSDDFKVRYVYKGKNVTGQVVAGSFTINLAPREGRYVKAIMKVKKSARAGDSYEINVQANSAADDGAPADTVSYAVTAK